MNKQSPLSYLLVAGGAILFFTCFLPTMDSFSTLIQNKINLHSGKLQKDMMVIQKEINEIQEDMEEPPVSTHAVGFSVDSQEYYPDDEEYEDE